MKTQFLLLKLKRGSISLAALTLGGLICTTQAQEEQAEETNPQEEEQGGLEEEQVQEEELAQQEETYSLPEEVDVLLKKMSDRLAKAKTFAIKADLLIDEVLDSGLLVQRAAELKLQAQRPDGLRAKMTSDTEERTMWYNGKTMTIADTDDGVHVEVPVPDKIGPAMDYLMDHYGVSVALSDFFYENPYEVLTANVQRAYYIGKSQVNGVPCHHLAFAQEVVDWQIWIEEGERPLPRKLVIVYKDDPGVPQYSAVLTGVELQDPVPKETFDAVIPEGSLRIDLLDFAPEETASK